MLYKAEIYNEELFKTAYSRVYSELTKRLRDRGLEIEDYEFSQFLLDRDGMFFLSYYDQQDEDTTATLEGQLSDMSDLEFEIEGD